MKTYNKPTMEIIIPLSTDCITASNQFRAADSGSGDAVWDWSLDIYI